MFLLLVFTGLFRSFSLTSIFSLKEVSNIFILLLLVKLRIDDQHIFRRLVYPIPAATEESKAEIVLVIFTNEMVFLVLVVAVEPFHIRPLF